MTEISKTVDYAEGRWGAQDWYLTGTVDDNGVLLLRLSVFHSDTGNLAEARQVRINGVLDEVILARAKEDLGEYFSPSDDESDEEFEPTLNHVQYTAWLLDQPGIGTKLMWRIRDTCPTIDDLADADVIELMEPLGGQGGMNGAKINRLIKEARMTVNLNKG